MESESGLASPDAQAGNHTITSAPAHTEGHQGNPTDIAANHSSHTPTAQQIM